MLNRNVFVGVAVVLITGFATAATSHANLPMSRVNHLTFGSAVALPGVVLARGTYVFELPEGHLDIVRVRTRDTGEMLYMGFTTVVPRPEGLPRNSAVTFGEAPAGQAQPIAAWFPIGGATGRQFIYR